METSLRMVGVAETHKGQQSAKRMGADALRRDSECRKRKDKDKKENGWCRGILLQLDLQLQKMPTLKVPSLRRKQS